MKTHLVIMLSISSLCYTAENDPPKIVKDQLEKIGPSIEKAKNEFAKVLKSENERLIKYIEAAMSKEIKAGNLDSAVALKAALEKANKGDYINGLLNVNYNDLLGEMGLPGNKFEIEVPATGNSNKIQVSGKLGLLRIQNPDGIHILRTGLM